ncbi:uncharacterized protein LOC112551534 [Alligator sinensis]|uniref:Uncharacterized protein LOC112551534 n=1 Tax=Alligator sinensis TaxID=38654 RepID=A0A3Q0HE35_ALLSI|nr:uncharacterized protein LOC112551534 [Alligator sinensis]
MDMHIPLVFFIFHKTHLWVSNLSPMESVPGENGGKDLRQEKKVMRGRRDRREKNKHREDKTRKNYLPLTGAATQQKQREKPMQLISRAFIQLRPAGDVTRNPCPAGIKVVDGQGGGGGRTQGSVGMPGPFWDHHWEERAVNREPKEASDAGRSHSNQEQATNTRGEQEAAPSACKTCSSRGNSRGHAGITTTAGFPSADL